jgi:hypothetical protein
MSKAALVASAPFKGVGIAGKTAVNAGVYATMKGLGAVGTGLGKLNRAVGSAGNYIADTTAGKYVAAAGSDVKKGFGEMANSRVGRAVGSGVNFGIKTGAENASQTYSFMKGTTQKLRNQRDGQPFQRNKSQDKMPYQGLKGCRDVRMFPPGMFGIFGGKKKGTRKRRHIFYQSTRKVRK